MMVMMAPMMMAVVGYSDRRVCFREALRSHSTLTQHTLLLQPFRLFLFSLCLLHPLTSTLGFEPQLSSTIIHL